MIAHLRASWQEFWCLFLYGHHHASPMGLWCNRCGLSARTQAGLPEIFAPGPRAHFSI